MRADPGELAFRKMLIASPALALLFPSYQFSIRLSLSSSPLRAINLRLRQWRRCITRPLRMRACVRAYRSPLLLLPLRSLSDSYLAVPTASCSPYARTGLRKNRTQRHAHRSYYLIILSTLSKRKRDDCPWARERRGAARRFKLREFSLV